MKIKSLKCVSAPENGRAQDRIIKLESQAVSLEEEIDTLEKRLLSAGQL